MFEYLFLFQRILISKRNTARHQPSQLQKIRKILIMETFRDLFFRFFFGHAAPTVADYLRIPDFKKKNSLKFPDESVLWTLIGHTKKDLIQFRVAYIYKLVLF